MKKFLKNFFSGEKSLQEKRLVQEENKTTPHDIIEIKTLIEEQNMEQTSGCGCGNCSCGKQG